MEDATDWNKAFNLYQRVVSCKNETLRVKATVQLGRLSKNAPESLLAQAVPILVQLLDTPLSPLSPSIHEVAADCLNRFARRGGAPFCAIIARSGAVPPLLRLLPVSQSQPQLQRLLFKCLRTIVSCNSVGRLLVARHGGFDVVLSLFTSCADSLRMYLLEILTALAMLREVRRVIISSGAAPLLIESAQSGKVVSRTRAAQAIGSIAVTTRARRILVNLGVVPVLVGLMRSGDLSAKLTAGNALGIVSSHIDYLRPVAREGAIPLYAELLEGQDSLGREIAEDAFCILAVAEENAVVIAEHLVRILQGEDDEAKAAAADVLWDLSSYKHSVPIVRNSGAIPLLLELLGGRCVDVREKASGAIAQLSYDEHDRGALADAGAIPVLINLLQDESEELKDNVAEALINFSEDPIFMESISEVFSIPSFQEMQSRFRQIRASDERMERSMQRMSVEQFDGDSELF